MVLKQIERVLRIIQIYHLEILEKNFSSSRLIQAVNLLPDITSLKIHSLSTDETTNANEFVILSSMKKRSKIISVYLEEIGDIRVLDFF